jgi:hypothetical protein
MRKWHVRIKPSDIIRPAASADVRVAHALGAAPDCRAHISDSLTHVYLLDACADVLEHDD